MDKNLGGAIAAVILCVAVFAAKMALVPKAPDPNVVAEENKKKQDEERARRIAGQEPPFQLDEPKEGLSITFPSKPTPKDIVLIGLNVGHDKDWESHWLDDARFTVHRRTSTRGIDEKAAREAARRKIDYEQKMKAGTPELWIIGAHREFQWQDQFPAAEFTYTYKKYSHQEPRSGRVLIVKVPENLFYIQADGPPDYIAGPVTERFFTSFRYTPQEKKPALPKKQ